MDYVLDSFFNSLGGIDFLYGIFGLVLAFTIVMALIDYIID